MRKRKGKRKRKQGAQGKRGGTPNTGNKRLPETGKPRNGNTPPRMPQISYYEKLYPIVGVQQFREEQVQETLNGGANPPPFLKSSQTFTGLR